MPDWLLITGIGLAMMVLSHQVLAWQRRVKDRSLAARDEYRRLR